LRHLERFRGKADEDIFVAEVRLQEVQFALALEYGFTSWTELKHHVTALTAPHPPKEKLMNTDWDLIRNTLLATIDACEQLEALEIQDCEAGDHRARSGDYETGVGVGDFLHRFYNYPEDAASEVLKLRGKLNVEDRDTRREFGRALVAVARACTEIIGISPEDLSREAEGHEPHCHSAGASIRSQLEGISGIYRNWMVPEITNAITAYRAQDWE